MAEDLNQYPILSSADLAQLSIDDHHQQQHQRHQRHQQHQQSRQQRTQSPVSSSPSTALSMASMLPRPSPHAPEFIPASQQGQHSPLMSRSPPVTQGGLFQAHSYQPEQRFQGRFGSYQQGGYRGERGGYSQVVHGETLGLGTYEHAGRGRGRRRGGATGSHGGASWRGRRDGLHGASMAMGRPTPVERPTHVRDVYATEGLRENARGTAALRLAGRGGGNGIPERVNQYYAILPLDKRLGMGIYDRSDMTIVSYKSVSSNTGDIVTLRRLVGPPPAQGAQIVRAGATWKRIRHPSISSLREVFTTRELGAKQSASMRAANEVIFAYDHVFQPESLYNTFLAGDRQFHPLGETTLWALVTQLLAGIQVVHDASLALRASLSLTAILIHGHNRIKISDVGITDAFDKDGGDYLPNMPGGPNVGRLIALQKEDLVNAGRILLTVAVRSQPSYVRMGELVQGIGPSLDALRGGLYSLELIQCIGVLCAAGSPTSQTNIQDVLNLIGPRLAKEMSNVWVHADNMENQLMRECDASRMFRLITMLGFVNERSDVLSDPNWSETGDRYLLKLFRDYMFHQVDRTGKPIMEIGHVLECLNRLDMGSDEKILLTSRDGKSLLIPTYADLRRCLQEAIHDLESLRGAPS